MTSTYNAMSDVLAQGPRDYSLVGRKKDVLCSACFETEQAKQMQDAGFHGLFAGPLCRTNDQCIDKRPGPGRNKRSGSNQTFN
ncbi:hypothetical protein M8818_004234 [Zalaria obscura]|uniref:Uncharacterized protein n=1 Tax=Zalaria obscura TaxID=2024903 RepID=A0ACC3SCH8_9PEZI